ncbi:MAG: hypothetical protein HY221_02075, partial [Candidatus Sungbacteria bacterium]|nr:hypothetical protein [Candidatus Sungbacteria bacterium]
MLAFPAPALLAANLSLAESPKTQILTQEDVSLCIKKLDSDKVLCPEFEGRWVFKMLLSSARRKRSFKKALEDAYGVIAAKAPGVKEGYYEIYIDKHGSIRLENYGEEGPLTKMRIVKIAENGDAVVFSIGTGSTLSDDDVDTSKGDAVNIRASKSKPGELRVHGFDEAYDNAPYVKCDDFCFERAMLTGEYVDSEGRRVTLNANGHYTWGAESGAFKIDENNGTYWIPDVVIFESSNARWGYPAKDGKSKWYECLFTWRERDK